MRLRPLKGLLLFFVLRERSVLRDDFSAGMLPPVPQTDICPAHCGAHHLVSASGLPVK